MKKESTVLSICIPTFNRSAYLKICIDSLLAYRGKDIEVVIQDNHSEDDTEALVKKYIEIDSRVTYEKNPSNLGMMENLFKTIERAKGEYVFILSDDDYILSGGVEKILSLIEEDKPTAFNCAKIIYFEKSKKARYYSAISSRNNLSDSEKAKVIMFSHIFSGTSFQRDLVDVDYLRGFADTYYAHVVAIGLASERMSYINEPVVFHVWENETHWGESVSFVQKNCSKYFTKIIKGLDKLDDALFEQLVIEASLSYRHISNDLRIYIPKKTLKEVKWNILKLKAIDFLKSLVARYGKN